LTIVADIERNETPKAKWDVVNCPIYGVLTHGRWQPET
jgi:hypothetical protein